MDDHSVHLRWQMEKELGVPVMDALKTSIQTAEMMVRMGLTHSVRTYPRPSAK
jgi:Asp/Glu/hydantoin racemase